MGGVWVVEGVCGCEWMSGWVGGWVSVRGGLDIGYVKIEGMLSDNADELRAGHIIALRG